MALHKMPLPGRTTPSNQRARTPRPIPDQQVHLAVCYEWVIGIGKGQIVTRIAMHKLLHLVFAIWKSGRPFDPGHYPWPTLAHVEINDNDMSAKGQLDDSDMSAKGQAAGHKPDRVPAKPVVTAACADSVAEAAALGESTFVDFAHLKGQLPLARLLDELGLSGRLRDRGLQRRCACPLHRGDGRGRTFSVNLDDNVFHCFDPQCGRKGDVIDLWAAVHSLSLREAALDLVRTFSLEPSARGGTEKRNG